MDRRQRRTRKAIFDAFEQLMAEEHYAHITVGQIIERADIGRSTFYAHFVTKDDLLDQMCTEMFAHVFEGVETDAHTHAHTHAHVQEPTVEGMLCHLLCHLRDNHDGISGKLLAEGEPHFTGHFRALLEEFFETRLPERSSWVPRDLMLTLVVSGFCQAVGWWYEGGYEAAPEDLAHWYARSMGWQTSRHA